jgi:hypothetical protein
MDMGLRDLGALLAKVTFLVRLLLDNLNLNLNLLAGPRLRVHLLGELMMGVVLLLRRIVVIQARVAHLRGARLILQQMEATQATQLRGARLVLQQLQAAQLRGVRLVL